MAYTPATVDDSSGSATRSRGPDPGVLVIFSAGRPAFCAIPLEPAGLVLGRDHSEALFQADERLSRRHAEISFESGAWTVRDLQSRNGTHVNGRPITGPVVQAAPRVVRLGRTVCILTTELRRFTDTPGQRALLAGDGMVSGPGTREALELIAQAARSETVLITGESGTGKELAARAFHAAGPFAAGAFVPVNCAAIPQGVAERLLFGAKKGAFSGAVADVGGYIQAAEGGVLFLDEVGELDLEVQAKLLRLLESREVLPLGASVARRVRVGICLATHRDLRADVAQGRFRADLFYRIADLHVRLPPLRERPEEIPWLISRELDRIGRGLEADARLIEACLMRPWPGNVREILGAIRRAGQSALSAGETAVTADSLEPAAGNPMSPAEESSARVSQPEITRDAIESELKSHSGNISAAARGLGLHRTQLYRLMKRFGVEVLGEK